MAIDNPVQNLKGHWRQYNGEADLNAVSMANDLVVDNISFTDMFPDIQCGCKK